MLHECLYTIRRGEERRQVFKVHHLELVNKQRYGILLNGIVACPDTSINPCYMPKTRGFDVNLESQEEERPMAITGRDLA